MAAGDVQIAIPNGPAPTTKKVVGETPVVPKAINGTFDGTGAAGPFLPCLVIAGKEGFEVARIPAPQVAAGASAEVSWFPRVGGQVAAAASGIGTYLALTLQGSAPLPSGALLPLNLLDPAASMLTDDRTGHFEFVSPIPDFDGINFQIDSAGAPNQVILKTDGFYYLRVRADASGVAAGTFLCGANVNAAGFNPLFQVRSPDPFGGGNHLQPERGIIIRRQGSIGQAHFVQFSGANWPHTTLELSVYFLGEYSV